MRTIKGLLVITSAALLAGVAACGGTTPTANESPEPSTTATTPTQSATTEPATTQMSTRIYLLRGEKVVSVHRDVAVTGSAVAAATMRALLEGPSAAERAAGLGTTIPTGTRLNGVTIKDGTADVDLTAAYESGGGSLSMFARLMQVTFTLTQFPTVQRVTFRLDGKPVTVFSGEGIIIDHPATRAQYESFLPPIFIDSPAMGESVTSPVTVRGVANVFEGQFNLEVTDATGKVLATGAGHASMGSYTAFSTTLRYTVSTPTAGKVIGFDYSAKDGSRIDDYVVPVTLK